MILVGCSCNFSDTAEYRISALNVKGESSAFASVIIKSEYFTFLKWISNLQLFLNNVLCAVSESSCCALVAQILPKIRSKSGRLHLQHF